MTKSERYEAYYKIIEKWLYENEPTSTIHFHVSEAAKIPYGVLISDDNVMTSNGKRMYKNIKGNTIPIINRAKETIIKLLKDGVIKKYNNDRYMYIKDDIFRSTRRTREFVNATDGTFPIPTFSTSYMDINTEYELHFEDIPNTYFEYDEIKIFFIQGIFVICTTDNRYIVNRLEDFINVINSIKGTSIDIDELKKKCNFINKLLDTNNKMNKADDKNNSILYFENVPDLIKKDDQDREYIEFHHKGKSATLLVYRDLKAILVAGSIRNSEQNLSYDDSKYDALFVNNRLIKNIETTPSGAAGLIQRSSSSGYIYWKDDNGNLLDYYRTKKTLTKVPDTESVIAENRNVATNENCIRILSNTPSKPIYKFDDNILEEDEHGRYVSTHLQYKKKKINCHIKVYENGECLVPAGETIDDAIDEYVIKTRKNNNIPINFWKTTKDIWCNSLNHLISHVISSRPNRCYDNVILDSGGTMSKYYVKRTKDDKEEVKSERGDSMNNEYDEIVENSSTDDINIETEWDSNERKAKTIISNEMVMRQAEATADAIISKIGSTSIKVENIKQVQKSDGLATRTLRPVKLKTGKEIKWPNNYNIDKIIKIIQIKHFLLLIGVPGTGKSTASKEIARSILQVDESDQVLALSFNSATEYNDIVGGVKLMDDGEWRIKTGELTNICKLAKENPDKKYIVLIDEINRGDTTGVLGEYITALADIGSEVTTNFGISICIPNNLYIIATMNTYDSSIIELDDALKNRFAQITMNSTSFTADDIKPYASDELKLGIKLTIEAISNINKKLKEEAFKGDNNTIGLRNLYTNYDDINGLLFIIESCIEPNIRDHYRNLDEESIRSIKEILKKLVKDLSEIEE